MEARGTRGKKEKGEKKEKKRKGKKEEKTISFFHARQAAWEPMLEIPLDADGGSVQAMVDGYFGLEPLDEAGGEKR